MSDALKAAAQLTGRAALAPEVAVKPQLAPCYTNYPSHLAAVAAVGLTAYLEYEARAGKRLLLTQMAEYLKNPAEADCVRVDESTYRQVAHHVANAVHTRLILHDLSRAGAALASVEIYRLFAAAQVDLRCCSLKELIDTAIIYGDLLPPPQTMNAHPSSRRFLGFIGKASSDYLPRLSSTEDGDLLCFGIQWVHSVCRKLAPYLPNETPTVRDAIENVGAVRCVFHDSVENRRMLGEIRMLHMDTRCLGPKFTDDSLAFIPEADHTGMMNTERLIEYLDLIVDAL